MKKSVIAMGIFVTSGVVWVGATWFTGKQIEKRLAEMTAQVNNELKHTVPEAGLEISYQNYQRGVFTSKMQLIIKPIAGVQNAWLKAGQSVGLDEVIDHGPFPMAQLKHVNLSPVMASVRSTLVNNDFTRRVFDLAKDKTPVVIDTRISYAGDTRSDFTLKPLDYGKGDEKMTFSGGNFRLNTDRGGKALSLIGDVQSGLVNTVNKYGQRVQLSFNNLKTDSNSRLTSFDERIGDQKISIEKLDIAVEGKEVAVLEGMILAVISDISRNGKSINSQLDCSLKNLKVQSQNLGSGKLTLKISNIDGQAWHQFNQNYRQQRQAALAEQGLTEKSQELYQQKIMDAFSGNLPLLLKGEPVITIAPLSWKNSKGEATFNLSISLKDPATTTAQAQTLAQEVDRSVKSLESTLSIPVDMATEMMTRISTLSGYNEADAAKLASQQVKSMAAMGQMFRVTTLEDNVIGSSLQYSSGLMTLNGQKMPLEEFVGMFGLPSSGLPEPAMPSEPAIPQ
ncbi:YdgA family protein [Citrobacter meridianamericanus]|uniref:YdgA family protein n=1 Tax=Citrobacter meridianamericanus TaxID=2894201 RepID=A0ABT1BH36_9ENTR|nr:YdgA family protein [Citrobacter meridianamericanus]MCO5784529.1 YdgA family protein [Citrobacter meridianamericanus]